MNRLHGLYPIHNDDFLYVLSTFVYAPIRWNARFGWRPLTTQEKLAAFHFWRVVGQRMNIRAIPESFEELERFNVEYERREFRYADRNRDIADATKTVFRSWFPAPLGRLVDAAVYALLDEPALDAFGYPHSNPATRRCVEAGLRLRAQVVRGLPRRRRPRLLTKTRHPRGYRVDKLGATAAHAGGTAGESGQSGCHA